MTLNITIAPESELLLRERAASSGEDISLVLGRLVDQVIQQQWHPLQRTPGEFAERMRAWSRLHPVRDHLVDDSCEAIYQGCGE